MHLYMSVLDDGFLERRQLREAHGGKVLELIAAQPKSAAWTKQMHTHTTHMTHVSNHGSLLVILQNVAGLWFFFFNDKYCLSLTTTPNPQQARGLAHLPNEQPAHH